MLKRLEFFWKLQQVFYKRIFFFVLVKSYSISPVYFAVHYGKSFDRALLFLFVSVDHLFDNLDSRKKKFFLFWKKSEKKNLCEP